MSGKLPDGGESYTLGLYSSLKKASEVIAEIFKEQGKWIPVKKPVGGTIEIQQVTVPPKTYEMPADL